MNQMNAQLEKFARSLVPSPSSVDHETLKKARDWYKKFAGTHAVPMADREVLEIYLELH